MSDRERTVIASHFASQIPRNSRGAEGLRDGRKVLQCIQPPQALAIGFLDSLCSLCSLGLVVSAAVAQDVVRLTKRMFAP